jgi:hypothetical protein
MKRKHKSVLRYINQYNNTFIKLSLEVSISAIYKDKFGLTIQM